MMMAGILKGAGAEGDGVEVRRMGWFGVGRGVTSAFFIGLVYRRVRWTETTDKEKDYGEAVR